MRGLIGGRGAAGVALGVVLLLAGLAGCAAPSGPAAATGQRDAAAVWRQLVRCARSHGMPNLPDPRIDGDGQAHFPSGTPDPPQTVRRACQSVYDRLPASARGDTGRPPADIQALVRFAACMRQHGMPDFPDPAADGRFLLPQSMQRQGKTPRFLQATRACRQLNPDPRGRVEFRG